MLYLCLGYFNPKKMDERPNEEIEAIMSQCPSHLETFYESRQVKLDAGLGVDATYMQRKQGEVVATNHPTGEEVNRVGSVFIIEAENIEEAKKIASFHPTVQVEEGEGFDWRLEIRPIDYWKDFRSLA